MPLVNSSRHLPGHGRISIVEQRRPNGVLAYRVTGAAPHGTVAFKPDVRDEQPVPDRVVVRLGDGEHLLATIATMIRVCELLAGRYRNLDWRALCSPQPDTTSALTTTATG